jgi:serine/threonine-protein kinase
MATVYLARDLRHHRQVALKVLRRDLAASLGPERFLREIQIAGQLSHANILALHDSGEAGGLLYYVMPYVEGDSLRQRLDREKQLSLVDALRIAHDVADALAYAHARGVIHRDIKPENILLHGDRAVVSDFGIARAIGEAGGNRLTETGLAVGTPTYMSTEQASGAKDLDARTDVYSLGCVLYEMLAGHPPFTGATAQAILARKAVEPVPRLRVVRETVPVAVERAVTRALAKVPADRFATAAQFKEALEHAWTDGASLAERGLLERARAFPRWRWLVAAALLITIGVFAAFSRTGVRSPPAAATPPVEQVKLAVLPFENLSGDPGQDYFSSGLTEEMITQLGRLDPQHLGVIARTSAMRYKNANAPIDQIGRELGVQYVLEGSARRESGRVRITTQLIRVSDQTQLWAESYDRELTGIIALQSEVARGVAKSLALALLPHEEARLAAKPTDNLQAYDSYLRGNDFLAQVGDPEALQTAERMYMQAAELDPTFALALARLGRARIWQFHFTDRTEGKLAAARAAVDSALALDPDLPEAHLALGQIHYWGKLEYQAALRELRIAHEGDPGNGDIAWARGLVERRLGQWDQALASLRKAVELDPRSVVKHMDVFEVYLRQREYGAAERYLERALALQPDAPIYVYKAIMVVTRDGDLAAATKVLEEGARRAGLQSLAALTPQYDLGAALWHRLPDSAQRAVDGVTLSMVGTDSAGYYLLKARIQRLRGNGSASRAYFDSAAVVLAGRTASRPDDPYFHADLGFAYAGLGRRDDAMREGRRAVELRPVVEDTWLGVDMLRNLAVTYATLGEADSAVKQLRVLLEVPSWISVPALRADPTWDPIRRDPRFRALIAGARRVGGVASR